MAWARAGEVPARPLLAGLARHLAPRAMTGVEVELLDVDGVDGFPPMPDDAGPDLLGLAHEALLAPADRRARGAHYTPPALADRLVALTLAPDDRRILDPACGGGAFLLAAGRALQARGLHPADAVTGLAGVDIDPLAAEVARAATALWSGSRPAAVTVGDFLAASPSDEVDAVVGNPPFGSPLRRAVTPVGSGPAAYTDTAGRFLLTALDAVRPRGRVGLIQPQSVLGARDAAPVRDGVEARAALRALWVAGAPVFAAATNVVAVVAERSGAPGLVDLYGGPDVVARGSAPVTSWAALAAAAAGVPAVALPAAPTIADEARVTAGFRRQFYGLADHVGEGGGGSPLVTVGLIDPGRCVWGQRDTRIAGRRRRAPTVDLAVVDPDVADWFGALLVPKLLVATQTRVVEVAVDEAGAWLPAVPVIAVTAPGDRLWALAAALSAPPVTAWALARAAGTGLSGDSLRLSAGLVRSVPLPTDPAAWDGATAAFRAGDLERFAPLACRAYGAPVALAAWWLGRLPTGLG